MTARLIALIGGLLIGAGGVAAQGIDFTRQRLELDRTVWAQECVAQEYGATFVALWDSLRSHARARPVLEQFSFGALLLGSVQPVATRLDWDVVETTDESDWAVTVADEVWNKMEMV